MLNSLSLNSFKKFNPSILDLGEIEAEADYIHALAAVFDLEGFSSFCHQSGSHLEVPEYLNDFLWWLFTEISTLFKEGQKKNRVRVWGSLPFFAKFMGDGVLFLWDTERSGAETGIGNIILRLDVIRKRYVSEFLPQMKSKIDNPPQRLRCGIARGQIMSIGNGQDYVGSCINIASRLQKIGKLAFAFKRTGLDPVQCFDKRMAKYFVTKRVNIRGIGDDRLIVIEQKDYEALPIREKRQFRDP
jgi:hypothetical protein